MDPRITDELSSQTGEQGGTPERDKKIKPLGAIDGPLCGLSNTAVKRYRVSPTGKDWVRGGSQFLPLAGTRRLEKLDGCCKKEEIAVHCNFFLRLPFL